MNLPHTSAFAPFDGSGDSSNPLPYITAPPSTSGAPAGSLYLPSMFPSQAFFMGSVAKAMFLKLDVLYVTVNYIGVMGFETISTANLIKRYQTLGNSVCNTKFVTQPGALATTQFILDFSAGTYGWSNYGGLNYFGYKPLTVMNLAASHGVITIAASPIGADGVLYPAGFPNFKEGSINGIGFSVGGSSSNYQISDPEVLTATLQLTERFDQISITPESAVVGSTVTIVCPAVNSNFDGKSFRSGFQDVTQLQFCGSSIGLTPASAISPTNFVLSSSISGPAATQDIITCHVPADAKTGPITFISQAVSGDTTTTDTYQTFGVFTVTT